MENEDSLNKTEVFKFFAKQAVIQPLNERTMKLKRQQEELRKKQ